MVTLVSQLPPRIILKVSSSARLSPVTAMSTVSKSQNKNKKNKTKTQSQYFSKVTTLTANKNTKAAATLKIT